MLILGIDKDQAGAAAGAALDRDQGFIRPPVAQDTRAVPGDFSGVMAQEIILVQAPPERQRLPFADILLTQQGQGLPPGVPDPLPGQDRPLPAAPQLAEGALIEIAQERRLPVIPEFGAGALDIGHGQEIQMIEVILIAHLTGKAGDGLGVVEVFALGGLAHQKMPIHEPGHESGVIVAEFMQPAECQRVFCAEPGVIAAPPLGNIVEQAGQVEQFEFGYFFDDRGTERKPGLVFGQIKAAQIADHGQDVFVHGKDVEQVKLHEALDSRKGRQIGPENAVAVHEPEFMPDPPGLPDDLHEQAAVADVPAKFIID